MPEDTRMIRIQRVTDVHADFDNGGPRAGRQVLLRVRCGRRGRGVRRNADSTRKGSKGERQRKRRRQHRGPGVNEEGRQAWVTC